MLLFDQVQGGGPPGDDTSIQHRSVLLLGRFLLGAEEGPGAAAHRPRMVGGDMVFHTMSRGEFGVAGGVESANWGNL